MQCNPEIKSRCRDKESEESKELLHIIKIKKEKIMIKVNAKETKISIGKFAGSYRYVLSPMLYTTLPASKVINEAVIRSGLSKGTITAAYQAIGDTLAAWATEGHGVTIPGLGIMRFGLRADSVATAEEVASRLITSRRVLFTPSTVIKEELAKMGVSITCYDRNGKKVKTVKSEDDKIEDGTDDTDDKDNTGNDKGNPDSGDNNPGETNPGGNEAE